MLCTSAWQVESVNPAVNLLTHLQVLCTSCIAEMEKHDAFAAEYLDGPVYVRVQALLVLWPKCLAMAGLVSTW